MEGIQVDESFRTVLDDVAMEDSLFPYISENFNRFMVSGHERISGNFQRQLSQAVNESSDLEADSMPESQMELTEADVYTQLEHKERDLILAAELGKSLLEKNEELASENERLNHEYHDKLEALEQEKHELRRKLEYKASEYEASSLQLHVDLKRAQDELEERSCMLVAVEREKVRAVEELSEQNHKLLGQLHRASEAEERLSKQVQQLRKEFLERATCASVRILQLESQKEEIEEDSQTRANLEVNFESMKDETLQLRDDLAKANEKAHHLERLLHDKDRELKRVTVELNETHISNRQLQVRIDELREEMSLQMSFASTGNASLLAELEQSGEDCGDIISPPIASSNDVENDKERFRSDSNIQKSVLLEDMTSDLTLRCYQSLLSGITNCHQQLFELKQEMWEMYQRVQSITTVLRTYVKKHKPSDDEKEDRDTDDSHSTQAINLSSVLTDLSSLVHEVIRAKEFNPDDEVVKMLKEKQESLMRERDEAVAAKNVLEVNLASAKVDLMSVNSQLLEAIQQKLHQQRELEAWQDDMEHMIQKGLNEKNDMKRANSVKNPRRFQQSNKDQPLQRTSWFSFRKSRQASGDSSATSSQTASPQATPKQPRVTETPERPGRLTAWLKGRQTPSESPNT